MSAQLIDCLLRQARISAVSTAYVHLVYTELHCTVLVTQAFALHAWLPW